MSETFLYSKPEQKNPKINVWFSYPAIESFAMASLGFLSIYKDLDCDEELYVERIYEDTKTTRINPKLVDAMGFSISFELDILAVIKMLKRYSFNLKAKERSEEEPIIFAGGPVLMANPIPYEDFFDFICIGEKIALKDAFKVLKEKNNLSRDELLKKLSKIEGIYVPKYKKNKVKITRDEIADNIIYTPILSDKSFFKNTFIIELERGCPKMCKFCLASWLNIPVRFVKYEKIIEAVEIGLKHTNKIALLGAYVAGHPDFNKIIEYISKRNKISPIELSVSSLRADLTDINLVKTLVECGQKSATIAIEAGSRKLRDKIGKKLSEEQILNTVLTAKKGGLQGLKMYFMLGLPDENESDIDEIIELAKKMKNKLKEENDKKNFELTFSFSTYIPKPHTPFEKATRCDKKILEKRIQYLKKNLSKLGVQFRAPSIEWDIIQTILSRYQNSLSDYLIDVENAGGNIGAFKQIWRKYAKKGCLETFEDSVNTPFGNIKAPKWNFIETGASL